MDGIKIVTKAGTAMKLSLVTLLSVPGCVTAQPRPTPKRPPQASGGVVPPAGTSSASTSVITPPSNQSGERMNSHSAAPGMSAPRATSAGNTKASTVTTSSPRPGLPAALAEGRKQFLAGNNDEAETTLRGALAVAEKSGKSEIILDCLSSLAECLEVRGQVDEARSLRSRAVDLAAKCFGAQSPRYAEQVAAMSGHFARAGDIEKATNQCELARRLVASASGSQPLAEAACLVAEGRRHVALRSFGLAEESFKKALELRESRLDRKDFLILATCKEYAEVLEQLGKKDSAGELRQRIAAAQAVAALPDSHVKGVSGHKATFDRLMQAAVATSEKSDREKSIESWKLVVSEAEKPTAGPERLAFALVKLGDSYLLAQRQTEAEPLFRRALDVRRSSSHPEGLGTARNLTRLATLCLIKSKPQEAEQLLTRAVQIAKKAEATSELRAEILQSLISASMAAKNFGQCEQACEQLLALPDSDSLNPTAKRLAKAMLGSVYMQTGRMSVGMQIMKEVGQQFNQADSAANAAKAAACYTAVEKEFDQAEEKTFRSLP